MVLAKVEQPCCREGSAEDRGWCWSCREGLGGGTAPLERGRVVQSPSPSLSMCPGPPTPASSLTSQLFPSNCLLQDPRGIFLNPELTPLWVKSQYLHSVLLGPGLDSIPAPLPTFSHINFSSIRTGPMACP